MFGTIAEFLANARHLLNKPTLIENSLLLEDFGRKSSFGRVAFEMCSLLIFAEDTLKVSLKNFDRCL